LSAAKPIIVQAVVKALMGFAALNPSYALRANF
jgi:hypothetical protein